MASQRLKNTLAFSNLAIGASVVLPHGLMTSQFRPLAPDIVFIPSAGLDVTTDEFNVTLTNVGPAPLSGSVLVEAWHTIERTFDGVQNVNLPVKPYIVVGVEQGNAPPWPSLVPLGTELRIYARATGSDATGNGRTPATAYRTLERAVRDVPQVIPPNLWVIVDITGIGVEALSADFTIPPFVAAGTLDWDFAGEFFFWRAPLNIQADPALVPMSPPTDATIAAPGDFAMTTDPQTGRITLTLTGAPRPDWGGNALKGKIVIGSGGAFEGARVVQSDTTFIVLSRTDGRPGSSGMITTPIRIMQESATLQPADGNGLFRGGVTLAGVTTAVFGGIVFLQPPSAFYPGLEIINCDDIVTQLCTVHAIDAQGGRVYVRNQTSYFPATTWGGTFVDVNFFGMRQCLYEEVGGFFFGSSGGDFFNVENTILGTGIITGARAWDPGGQGASLLNRLTNMDGLGAHDFGLNMGGGQAAGIDCRMDNYTGSAVKIANGTGFVDLIGVVGSGNGVGVIADNGSQIRADVTTNNPATGLLGTAGADYKAGSLAPAAWPGIAFNTPDPATFARVYGV